jgi:hypothetical protein
VSVRFFRAIFVGLSSSDCGHPPPLNPALPLPLQLPIPVGTSPTDAQLTKLADDLGFSGTTADEVRVGPCVREWRIASSPVAVPPTPHLPSPCAFWLQAKSCFANLYRMFVATDATQIEVNPLAETPDGKGACACACVSDVLSEPRSIAKRAPPPPPQMCSLCVRREDQL